MDLAPPWRIFISGAESSTFPFKQECWLGLSKFWLNTLYHFFRFWIGVSHVWIGFDGIYCQLIFLDLIWPTPSFSFLSIYQKNQCSQSSVWQHNLTSPFFFYHCFVYFLKQMFSAFPYFLSFLSVFIGLMFSDIIWPPPFFIILYPIITRSKFSGIFWPFPYFLISFF